MTSRAAALKVVVGAALATGLAAFALARGSPVRPGGDEVVLRVGIRAFTPDDLAARERIEEITHGPSDRGILAAHCQLIEAALEEAVLAQLGAPITADDLAEESDRIDRGTRAPERLEAVKKAAGRDESYRRLYVLPVLANRRFYFEVFPVLPIHRVRAQEAAITLAALLADERTGRAADLAAVATRDPRWRFTRERWSAARGLVSEVVLRLPALPPPREPPPADLVQLYDRLPANRLYQSVVDRPAEFLITRTTADEFHSAEHLRVIEMLSLPKEDAATFFWQRAGAIPVWIADQGVRRVFRSAVSWAPRVALLDGDR
jgi:hypothetical protein